MRVPAGTVTIGVQPPQGSESYRFQVTAKTEPWMSRFYEADVPNRNDRQLRTAAL